jgi:hypothetical protein
MFTVTDVPVQDVRELRCYRGSDGSLTIEAVEYFRTVGNAAYHPLSYT